MTNNLVFIIAAAGAVIAFLAAALKIIPEYQRSVMFTLGRYTGTMGPGLIFMIPIIQQMVRVDLRTRVLNVPTQDLITNDNVSVHVNAVVYFRVIEAEKAIVQVEQFVAAANQLAQTTLRSVLGQNNLDALLAERERLNAEIEQVLDEQTAAWGIKVSKVEIKQVDLDEKMIRVMARQAEAERNRRAKVIDATGEEQAAQHFYEAATVLSANPQAIHIRYLNALNAITSPRTKTIVMPLPLGTLDSLATWIARKTRKR